MHYNVNKIRDQKLR